MEAILSEGVLSTLHRQTSLRVDSICMRRLVLGERASLPFIFLGWDSGCLQSLEGLSEAYPEHHLLVVPVDGALSHRSGRDCLP